MDLHADFHESTCGEERRGRDLQGELQPLTAILKPAIERGEVIKVSDPAHHFATARRRSASPHRESGAVASGAAEGVGQYDLLARSAQVGDGNTNGPNMADTKPSTRSCLVRETDPPGPIAWAWLPSSLRRLLVSPRPIARTSASRAAPKGIQPDAIEQTDAVVARSVPAAATILSNLRSDVSTRGSAH